MSINLTQEFVFETDDLVSFELMFRSISEVLFDRPKELSINSKHWHWPDGKRDGPSSSPTRMLIAMIDPYKAEEESIVCSGMGEMLEKTMKMVRDADPEKFLEEFGAGYSSAFNRNDGSITGGYRMESGPTGAAWTQLYISMVHMHYGK